MTDLASWIAPILFGVALLVMFVAMLSRSLFATCMYLAAAGALAATGMAVLGAARGALLSGLLFVVWGPLVLLAVILLSTRTTKVQRRARPWLSIGSAIVVGGLVLSAMPELGALPRTLVRSDFVGGWIAPLVIVAGLACVGLLGYGERGAFQRDGDEI